MIKAVALLSGGLDSTLAVKLMIDQGIEVHALNFTSAFCTCDAGSKKKADTGGGIQNAEGCKGAARQVSEKFGVPIKVIYKGAEYIDIVRNPKYGYGKGINPCVDCRIFMFRAAKKYMAEIGASFIITGEVIGQRPMSQRLDNFFNIERDTGLEGLILRPLCARNLEPTIAEREGLVERDKLMNISGRGRRPIMDKADELDIEDYPCPSGGCLLTDKIFSKKVRDLLDHKDQVTTKDLQMLKNGRHFRFKDVKIIVGKDADDNDKIKRLVQESDTLIEPINFAGPNIVVAGQIKNGTDKFVEALLLRYSSGKAGPEPRVLVTKAGSSIEKTIDINTLTDANGFTQSAFEEYNVC